MNIRRWLDERAKRLSGEAVLDQVRSLVADLREREAESEAIIQEGQRIREDIRGEPPEDETERQRFRSAIDGRVAELEARAEALVGRDLPTRDEVASLNEQVSQVFRRRDRILRYSAQGGLLLQVLVFTAIAIFPAWSAKQAAGVHLEYYAAVAAIAPVLLIAGFVELGVLALPSGTWTVLTFAVPNLAAGWAALHVLATHASTPITASFAETGLVVSVLTLLGYVVGHQALGRE